MIKRMRYLFLSLWLSLTASQTLHAEVGHQKPWFTGPIQNNGNVMLKENQWYVFPDFYETKFNEFDQYVAYLQLAYGITDKWQVQIFPRYKYNTEGGLSSNGWGKFVFLLGYQFATQEDNGFWPAAKLNVLQTLPTGRFQNFSPVNQIVDSMGPAFYRTAISINTQHLSMPIPDHYMQSYLTLQYNYQPSRHISGFNSYGGGVGTNGVLETNQGFIAEFTLEYQITQHWAFLYEVNYKYSQAASFTGNPGVTLEGSPATVFKDRLNQFSLFPTLEYDFNAQWGVLAGVWFSVNDKINRFRSIQIAINYLSKV